MFRKPILIAVLVGLLPGAPFLGQGHAQTPLIVGGFSDSRSFVGSVSGESFSFISGPGFAFARSLLQDPTRFGPAGTVAKTITFAAGTAEISLATLQATDIFVLSLPPAWETPTELCLLERFVQQGGGLLEVRNVNPGRPTLLGTTPGTFVGDSTAEITAAGAGTPLIVGPFGSVFSITTGANGNYAVIGQAVAVATNSGPGGSGPNILLLSPATGFPGLGRAVFVGDEEIFMTGLFSGERAGQLDPVVRPFNDNEELFLNTFAFLAGAPGLSANANFSACAAPAIQEL